MKMNIFGSSRNGMHNKLLCIFGVYLLSLEATYREMPLGFDVAVVEQQLKSSRLLPGAKLDILLLSYQEYCTRKPMKDEKSGPSVTFRPTRLILGAQTWCEKRDPWPPQFIGKTSESQCWMVFPLNLMSALVSALFSSSVGLLWCLFVSTAFQPLWTLKRGTCFVITDTVWVSPSNKVYFIFLFKA